MGLGYCDESE